MHNQFINDEGDNLSFLTMGHLYVIDTFTVCMLSWVSRRKHHLHKQMTFSSFEAGNCKHNSKLQANDK